MITDSQTNFLYLADTLPLKYFRFTDHLEGMLKDHGIPYGYISGTKDVWAVDYMPVQVTTEKLVQFVYSPDYLLDTKKWRASITNVSAICEQMNLKTIRSDIVIDGGNVVRGTDKVIMCNKVFKENTWIPEKKLIRELEQLFEVDKVIFVPQQPHDSIGHADGMVRFLDDRTVLINDFSKEDKSFQVSFRTALHNAGLNWIEIPYNPYQNKTYLHANGTYINYLHMQQAVILPTFGLHEDDEIVKLFEQLFLGQTVATIPSNEIAEDGGVMNCITWNIVR